MADARWARLALEAGFLLAVAAILAVADVEPVWIAVVMLIAWVIVALLEWAAWHGEAHWASGRPPRYYVPQQPQPPRPPTRELPPFTRYPRAAPHETEAPTWIAPPELREAVLGWPAPEYEPEAQTSLQESTVEEPPPVPEEAVAVEEPVAEEVGPEPRPGVARPPAFAWWPEPAPVEEPVEEPVDDAVVVAEAAAAEPVAVEPVETEPEELLEAVVEPVELSFVDEATFVEPPAGELAAAIAEHDADGESAARDGAHAVEPVPEPPPPRAARHGIDPFPEPPSRRRRWRRSDDNGAPEPFVVLTAPPRHAAPPPRPARDEGDE